MNPSHRNSPAQSQFSLAALFEFITISSIVCAFSAATGIAASIYLIVLALSLWAKLGPAALLALMGAIAFADARLEGARASNALVGELAVCSVAAAICCWYGYTRKQLHIGIVFPTALHLPDSRQTDNRNRVTGCQFEAVSGQSSSNFRVR
jgi:hypothetical protein